VPSLVRRLVALAAVAAPILYLRRRAGRERLDVRFDDGSAVTLDRGAHADALLAIARSAL
jgi:hypothetical protein